MGVAVTIAGGGDVFFVFFFHHFSVPFAVKETGRGKGATKAVFAISNCESCTRPICRNPGSTEVGVYGLTREMSLVMRLLEVVAVAGLL